MKSRLAAIVWVFVVVAGLCSAAAAGTLQELNSELISLVRQCSPAVVEVTAQHETGWQQSKSVGPEGYMPRRPSRRSVGTGFVIDPGGYILTSAEVVDKAESVSVKFADGSTCEAKIAGHDALTGVAVIKVEKSGLPAVMLGDSDQLEPGAIVISINSQTGMASSVALGIVAGVNREAGFGGGNLIQISGTVGPGASGGPVFDADGHVVGLTSAMFSPAVTASFVGPLTIYSTPTVIDKLPKVDPQPGITVTPKSKPAEPPEFRLEIKPQGSATSSHFDSKEWQDLMVPRLEALQGMFGESAQETTRTSGSSGFAIPINRIKPILDDLKAGREVERAYLGVCLEDKGGIRVMQVTPGSAADKVGIKPNDIVRQADGRTFPGYAEFAEYIRAKKPGDKTLLRIRRDEQEIEVMTILGKSEEPDHSLDQRKVTVVRPSRKLDLKLSAKPFSLQLNNADIQGFVSALSKAAGANVVVVEPDKIKKRVTVHLKSTTIENALDVVCRSLGCAHKLDGGTYVISPK